MARDYQDEMDRGEAARRIVEDPLFVDSFAEIERECFEAWKASGWKDADKREALYRQLKALGEARTRLTAVMEGGKVARSLADKLLGEQKLLGGL
jgi:hypothetical protein